MSFLAHSRTIHKIIDEYILFSFSCIICNLFPIRLRQKKYRITPLGREVLRGEFARLRELYENGARILGENK